MAPKIMGRGSSEPVPRDVLVVCTANICRSPYIAAACAAGGIGSAVRSAGTSTEAGRPAAPQVVELAAQRLGVDLATHVSRPLRRSDVRTASVIITATRAHRIAVLRKEKRAAERTFTLLELARGARASSAPQSLAELIASAADAAEAESRDHDDDLADPWGLTDERYLQMADTVDEAINAIRAALTN